MHRSDINMLPKIAVLLATHNGYSWLKEQVDSILGQEAVSVSIFISDDLSSDGTYQLASHLSDSNRNISLLPQKKHGSASKNFHYLMEYVDVKSFDYISFSDQDDIWLKNKLSAACNKLQSNKYRAYSSNVIALFEGGKRVLINKASPMRECDYLFESAGPGCTYVIESSLVKLYVDFSITEHKRIDYINSHDWLLYAFVRSNDYDWYIDPSPSMFYRQHPYNLEGANIGFSAFISRFKRILNRSYRNKCLCIYAMFGCEDNDISGLVNEQWLSRILSLNLVSKVRRSPRDRFFLVLLIIFGIFR